MHHKQIWQGFFLILTVSILISGCATGRTQSQASYPNLPNYRGELPYTAAYDESHYVSMMPQHINQNHGRVIMVNPQIYAWGAYENGSLVRGGIANAGADFCKDEGHPCRTSTGSFKIYSLGDVGCLSRTYPIPEGGSLMPYCMFFNNGQSLHGTPDQMMVNANISHGCVHLRIPDAQWLRYNFAKVGTKVVVLPYN